MRLPHRLQGQRVKSQGGAGAYCGGHLAAQLVKDVSTFGSPYRFQTLNIKLNFLVHYISFFVCSLYTCSCRVSIVRYYWISHITIAGRYTCSVYVAGQRGQWTAYNISLYILLTASRGQLLLLSIGHKTLTIRCIVITVCHVSNSIKQLVHYTNPFNGPVARGELHFLSCALFCQKRSDNGTRFQKVVAKRKKMCYFVPNCNTMIMMMVMMITDVESCSSLFLAVHSWNSRKGQAGDVKFS